MIKIGIIVGINYAAAGWGEEESVPQLGQLQHGGEEPDQALHQVQLTATE
jgi:hypothetical protein